MIENIEWFLLLFSSVTQQMVHYYLENIIYKWLYSLAEVYQINLWNNFTWTQLYLFNQLDVMVTLSEQYHSAKQIPYIYFSKMKIFLLNI